jgi:hypothetical protein
MRNAERIVKLAIMRAEPIALVCCKTQNPAFLDPEPLSKRMDLRIESVEEFVEVPRR